MKTKIISRILLSLAVVFVLGSAITQVQGGTPPGAQPPAVSIHSAGNVLRGQTASFILETNSAALFGGMYVNFAVGGTAVAGVDYVVSATSLSPAYIGPTGYRVISFKTLRDPRGSANQQAYSIVVKLEPGLGYALGEAKSALIWIESSSPAGW